MTQVKHTPTADELLANKEWRDVACKGYAHTSDATLRMIAEDQAARAAKVFAKAGGAV